MHRDSGDAYRRYAEEDSDHPPHHDRSHGVPEHRPRPNSSSEDPREEHLHIVPPDKGSTWIYHEGKWDELPHQFFWDPDSEQLFWRTPGMNGALIPVPSAPPAHEYAPPYDPSKNPARASHSSGHAGHGGGGHSRTPSEHSESDHEESDSKYAHSDDDFDEALNDPHYSKHTRARSTYDRVHDHGGHHPPHSQHRYDERDSAYASHASYDGADDYPHSTSRYGGYGHPSYGSYAAGDHEHSGDYESSHGRRESGRRTGRRKTYVTVNGHRIFEVRK